MLSEKFMAALLLSNKFKCITALGVILDLTLIGNKDKTGISVR